MKVTVKDYLNVRVGKPSLNAPNFQYLAPGSILEVDGTLYPGDKFEGIDTWYKDEAGNYYWSGGVEKKVEDKKTTESNLVAQIEKIDYRELIKLKNPLANGFGEGVKVAVLDSGIYSNHPDLKGRIIQEVQYNFTDARIGDTVGHGTHMAGIIGANPASADSVSGFVPQATIIDIKITKSKSIVKENVANALSYIVNNNIDIDILNMSINVDDSDYYKKSVQPLLETLYNRGVVLVCAVGNDEDLRNTGMLTMGNFEKVISVGTVEADSLNEFKKTGFYRKVDFFFCNKPLTSTLSDPNIFEPGYVYGELDGSSPYTALVTGIIACYLSQYKPAKEICQQKVLEYLNALTDNYTDKTSLEYYTLYKATTI